MAFLWIVIAVVGELYAADAVTAMLSSSSSNEARVVDDAFRLLTMLAIPVFAFVVAVLSYSVFSFRQKGEPSQDGPAVHNHRAVAVLWVAVTTLLTLLVIVHPGITGMNELHAANQQHVDLVVKVEGTRWFWRMTYPDYNVTTSSELVLPVNKHVRFDVTATDVLHSFWVPAFRMKIDAVPGVPTTIYATPNKTGSYENDVNLRVQCAELCGVLHGQMTVPVRVVEDAQFANWLAQQKKSN